MLNSLTIICSSCSKPFQRSATSKHSGPCGSCKLKEKWRDPIYRAKALAANAIARAKICQNIGSSRGIISVQAKARWKDPTYRAKQKATRSTIQFKSQQSIRSRTIWADSVRKSALSRLMKDRVDSEFIESVRKRSTSQWKNPEYRRKTLGDNFKPVDPNVRRLRYWRHCGPYQILRRIWNSLKAHTRHPIDPNFNAYDLADEWYANCGKCVLTGMPMSLEPNRLDTVSIDRIDSSKGYSGDNVQLVCQFVNFGKWKESNESAVQFIKELKELPDFPLPSENDVRQHLTESLRLLRITVSMNVVGSRSSFDIDVDHLMHLWRSQDGICTLSGLRMSTQGHRSVSVDRIDSSKGHMVGNVCLVCRFMNLGRRHRSIEDMKKFVSDFRSVAVKPIASKREIDFSKLSVKRIGYHDADFLLRKHHYLKSIGRGGIYLGCFLDDKLVATCVFASILRMETATRLKCRSEEVMELSRFCIHPEFQAKNLASWFMSRCVKSVKSLRPKLKHLISFADASQGHGGVIYKAANWLSDGVISPDYHFEDKDGNRVHKRTVWEHAKRVETGELEHAESIGLTRVWDQHKYRFIWHF